MLVFGADKWGEHRYKPWSEGDYIQVGSMEDEREFHRTGVTEIKDITTNKQVSNFHSKLYSPCAADI